MYQIEQIYQKTPGTACVTLQYLHISDLTMLIPKLHRFTNLQSLCLHGNKIKFLPSLQCLKQLNELDLSHNPLKIDKKLLDSLFLIEKLDSLVIDIKSESDRETIIQNLPKLSFLNGVKIIRRKKPPKDPNEEIQKMKRKLQEEQGNAKILLNNIYNILDPKYNPPDFTQDFQSHLKCIMEQFQYFFGNINSELAKQCVYLYYKSKLYQVVDSNLMNYLEDNGFQNFAKVIQEMNKSKKQNFQDILRVCLSYAYEEDYQKKTIQKGNRLRKQTLYQNQLTRLKKKVADLTKQNQELQMSNGRYLEKIYQGGKSSVNSRSRGNLHTMNLSSKDNNDNRLLTVSNILAQTTGGSRIKSPRRSPSNNSQLQPSRNQSKRNLAVSGSKNQLHSISNQINYPNQRQMQRSPSTKFFPKNKQNENRFQKTNSMGSLSVKRPGKVSNSTHNNCMQPSEPKFISSSKKPQNSEKKVSLDQIVQLMDDFIYEKGKFNVQCYSKGQLFQTPQEFLYTYFLRKYGLKDMALQWSLIVIKAIQKFSKQIFLIEVFGKILKNNIQQEFYLRAKQFKEFINSSVIIKDSFSQSDVQQIFYNIFYDQPSQSLEKFLKKLQFQTLKGQRIYRRRPLIYRLQVYFVELHEKQIANFLQHFKLHDQDDDGILQEKQIQRCIFTFLKKYDEHSAFSEDYLKEKYQKIIVKRRKKGNMVSMTFSEFVLLIRQNVQCSNKLINFNLNPLNYQNC